MKQSNSRNSAFQLTASQGGWRNEHVRRSWTKRISTHSLTRRLTGLFLSCSTSRIIQLTASQGGWQIVTGFFNNPYTFQLTASQGGWLATRWKNGSIFVFQLTASQGGWRNEHVRRSWTKRISTHSLTRRLTLWATFILEVKLYFNSQPHKEADERSELYHANIKDISTHSLTRRLTSSQVYSDRIMISTHSLTRRLTISC